MIDREDYLINKKLHQDNTSFIYGEICSESLINILNEKYDTTDTNYNFIDIGSGCGRLCIDLYRQFNFNITGIEIDENRFEKSNSFCNNINGFDRIEFINSSFVNIYLGNYDILYCCNIIFSIEDNNILYNKIIKEFKGNCFLYSYNHLLLPYFVKKFTINSSWMKNVELFLFIL
jgi:2-polyprenyl-3-methyl-5-hydroxy-6-metoxy-1,4-benzoquinol methylase